MLPRIPKRIGVAPNARNVNNASPHCDLSSACVYVVRIPADIYVRHWLVSDLSSRYLFVVWISDCIFNCCFVNDWDVYWEQFTNELKLLWVHKIKIAWYVINKNILLYTFV